MNPWIWSQYKWLLLSYSRSHFSLYLLSIMVTLIDKKSSVYQLDKFLIAYHLPQKVLLTSKVVKSYLNNYYTYFTKVTSKSPIHSVSRGKPIIWKYYISANCLTYASQVIRHQITGGKTGISNESISKIHITRISKLHAKMKRVTNALPHPCTCIMTSGICKCYRIGSSRRF